MEREKPIEILRGPGAVEQRLVESRTVFRDLLRQSPCESDRKVLEEQIEAFNIALRDLRKKRKRPAFYRELDKLTPTERIMARLGKDIGRGRDVIYHGTRLLPAVLKTGKLIPPEWAECGVFFTRSAEIAAYFACLLGDKNELRSPGVLVIDRASVRQCYRLEPNRYNQFHDRNEREEVIWGRTVNFRRHLVGVVKLAEVSKKLDSTGPRHLPDGFAKWPPKCDVNSANARSWQGPSSYIKGARQFEN
jgi:hypothetical protein